VPGNTAPIRAIPFSASEKWIRFWIGFLIMAVDGRMEVSSTRRKQRRAFGLVDLSPGLRSGMGQHVRKCMTGANG
jgi:hypothetical protein